MSKFVDRYEGIGMSRNDTLIITVFTLTMTSCHHRKVTFVSWLKHIKELLCAFNAIVLMTLWRYTHDVTGRKAWKTTLSSCICSMQLRPSFLEQAHPEFTITASSKARLSIRTTWKEIINDDRRFLAIEEKFDQVNACWIYFFGYKHLHDAFRELSKRA